MDGLDQYTVGQIVLWTCVLGALSGVALLILNSKRFTDRQCVCVLAAWIVAVSLACYHWGIVP
jgi:hypothetical protein